MTPSGDAAHTAPPIEEACSPACSAEEIKQQCAQSKGESKSAGQGNAPTTLLEHLGMPELLSVHLLEVYNQQLASIACAESFKTSLSIR